MLLFFYLYHMSKSFINFEKNWSMFYWHHASLFVLFFCKAVLSSNINITSLILYYLLYYLFNHFFSLSWLFIWLFFPLFWVLLFCILLLSLLTIIRRLEITWVLLAELPSIRNNPHFISYYCSKMIQAFMDSSEILFIQLLPLLSKHLHNHFTLAALDENILLARK